MLDSRRLNAVVSTVLSLPISVPAQKVLQWDVLNHDTSNSLIAERFRSDLEEGAVRLPSGSVEGFAAPREWRVV